MRGGSSGGDAAAGSAAPARRRGHRLALGPPPGDELGGVPGQRHRSRRALADAVAGELLAGCGVDPGQAVASCSRGRGCGRAGTRWCAAPDRRDRPARGCRRRPRWSRCGRRWRVPGNARRVDATEEVEEERGRVFGSRESLHAMSVEIADPDADRVSRRQADAPGIAMAVGGAGLPGDARRVGRQFPSLRHVGSAQLAQRPRVISAVASAEKIRSPSYSGLRDRRRKVAPADARLPRRAWRRGS